MTADIRVQNEGSLFVLYGETKAGRDWLEENLDPDGMRWATGFVVEHRYVEPIVEGAAADGLALA